MRANKNIRTCNLDQLLLVCTLTILRFEQ